VYQYFKASGAGVSQRGAILLSSSLLKMTTADKETARIIKADHTNEKLRLLFSPTDVT
jgi:hypothetical protein